MKKIMVIREDGGISIVIPGDAAVPEKLLQAVLATPGYLSHQEIEDTDIPADRHFRNCWQFTDTIHVNMDKAREQHLNSLRKIRDEKLSALDVKYMRADERGDLNTKQSIGALKQQLRDLPQTLNLSTITTPEELKSFLPEILK